MNDENQLIPIQNQKAFSISKVLEDRNCSVGEYLLDLLDDIESMEVAAEIDDPEAEGGVKIIKSIEVLKFKHKILKDMHDMALNEEEAKANHAYRFATLEQRERIADKNLESKGTGSSDDKRTVIVLTDPSDL